MNSHLPLLLRAYTTVLRLTWRLETRCCGRETERWSSHGLTYAIPRPLIDAEGPMRNSRGNIAVGPWPRGFSTNIVTATWSCSTICTQTTRKTRGCRTLCLHQTSACSASVCYVGAADYRCGVYAFQVETTPTTDDLCGPDEGESMAV